MSDHQIGISVDGGANLVTTWTATCSCGWASERLHHIVGAQKASVIHLRVATRTVRCDGCGDVIPTKMATTVFDGSFCLECFDQAGPPLTPDAMVDDLRALAQELRPVTWDGA